LRRQAGEIRHTACGLGTSIRHTERDLFAVDPESASCEQCRQALETQGAAESPEVTGVDAKTLVRRFLERVINANDAAGWDRAVGDEVSEVWSSGRLNRLHELFPTWHATIDELIAEGGSVVMRYRVSCADPGRLLGPCVQAVKTDQLVIVRLSGRRISGFRAIVDDFGIWQESTIRDRAPVARHGRDCNSRNLA
jgi:predicted ester cyclase